MGRGFSEIVYKDALEFEFKNSGIRFEREEEFTVQYKNIILNPKFYADFIVFEKIILEVKSCEALYNNHRAQCMKLFESFKPGWQS